MNSNVLILFGALLALIPEVFFGIKALRTRTIRRKNVYTGITLVLLLGSLLGGLNVVWRMTKSSSYAPVPTPLPAQSQVIVHESKNDLTSAYGITGTSRSSFSGRDGMLHWTYQRQPEGQDTGVFTEAAGVIYERTVLPEKNEIVIVAVHLTDGKALWSTAIKSSQSSGNLAGVRLPGDKLLTSNGKLYFQVDEVMYVLNTTDGKILRTIKPEISGYLVANFAANNEALVINYTADGISDNIFVCLQLSDWNVLWKSQQGKHRDLIALQGNTLYTQREGVVALRVHDGSEVWRTRLPQLRIIASSASSEHVYMRVQNSAGSADASAYALDIHTGQLLWKVPVDTWSGGAPVEANGITYITDTNTFSAYKASNGQLLWQYKGNPLPDTAIAFNPYDVIYFSQPVVVDNVVFVTSNFTVRQPHPLRLLPPFCLGQCTPLTGIFAFRASDGKPYWHQQTGSWVDLVAAYK